MVVVVERERDREAHIEEVYDCKNILWSLNGTHTCFLI